MGRRTLLLLGALLLAALGTALVWVYVQGADDRARGNSAPITVYYTTAAIPLNTPASSIRPYLATKQVSAALAGGALTPSSFASIANLTSAVPIPANVPLTAAMFAPTDKTPAAIEIDPKMMAVAFPFSDSQRVAGFPVHGSLVTIFVTGSPGTGTGKTAADPSRTVPVLKHPVKVITVGNAPTQALARNSATSTTSTVSQTIITLLLSADDAGTVITAQANGQLYLGLLGPDAKIESKDGQPSLAPLTPADIFSNR